MTLAAYILDQLRRHRVAAHNQLGQAVLTGDQHAALRFAVTEAYTAHIARLILSYVAETDGSDAAADLRQYWQPETVLSSNQDNTSQQP